MSKRREFILMMLCGVLLITTVVGGGLAWGNYERARNADILTTETYIEMREQEAAFAANLFSVPLGYYGSVKVPFQCSDEYKESHVAEVAVSSEKDYLPVEIVKWTGDDYYLTVGTIGQYNDLIPIMGKDGVVCQWKQTNFWVQLGCRGILDVTLLEDSLLYLAHPFGVYEIDYGGNLLHSLPMPDLTHQATLTPEGTLLLVRTELDQVLEVTRDGDVVWEWYAGDHIKDYSAENYVNYDSPRQQFFGNIYARSREIFPDSSTIWTHVNSLQKLDDGYLISLRNQDLVVKVDEDGTPIWTFGALILKHQHHPVLLPDGQLLVYDNGNGRVVEFNPDGSVAWEYGGLSAPGLGSIEKLWNGNYLFPDCFAGRILEVSPDGEIMKELHIPGGPIFQVGAHKELPAGLKGCL